MKKAFGLFTLLIVYLIAIFIGGVLFVLLKDRLHYLLVILIADVAATIFVWLMGVLFKTPSMYDPYWSLQTFFLYLGTIVYFNHFNIYTLLP